MGGRSPHAFEGTAVGHVHATQHPQGLGVVGILLGLGAMSVAWFILHSCHPNPLAELVAAVGGDLNVEPRLSGGFAPPTEVSPCRSVAPQAGKLSPDPRIAIARL